MPKEREYYHFADFNCISNERARDKGFPWLEQYGFPFRSPDPRELKEAMRVAVDKALESRAKRGIKYGRMKVEVLIPESGNLNEAIEGRVFDIVCQPAQLSGENGEMEELFDTISDPVIPEKIADKLRDGGNVKITKKGKPSSASVATKDT